MQKTRKLCLRLVCLLLSLACLMPLCRVSATEAEEATLAENQTLTCAVHSGAYSRSYVIGRMQNGTYLTVLGESGDYYKIDCYDMTGYIHKSQVAQKQGRYYVNCTEGADVEAMTYTPHAQALELRHSLFELAKKQLGYPYVYGGSRPGGFDCSGLTYYLYGKHDIVLERRASDQLTQGIIVAREGMQVGDLVFFRESWETYPVSHVGIYVGNNQVIHASTSHGIEYATLEGPYFGANFLCARRIINTDTARLEELPVVNMQRGIMTQQGTSRRRAG